MARLALEVSTEVPILVLKGLLEYKVQKVQRVSEARLAHLEGLDRQALQEIHHKKFCCLRVQLISTITCFWGRSTKQTSTTSL